MPQYGADVTIGVDFTAALTQIQDIIDLGELLAKQLVGDMVDVAVEVLASHADPSNHWYGVQAAIDALQAGKASPLALPQNDPQGGQFWYGAGKIDGIPGVGTSPEGSIAAFFAQYARPKRARSPGAPRSPNKINTRPATTAPRIRPKFTARPPSPRKERFTSWERNIRLRAKYEKALSTGKVEMRQGGVRRLRTFERRRYEASLELLKRPLPQKFIDQILKAQKTSTRYKREKYDKIITRTFRKDKRVGTKSNFTIYKAGTPVPLKVTRVRIIKSVPGVHDVFMQGVHGEVATRRGAYAIPVSRRGGIRYTGLSGRPDRQLHGIRSVATVLTGAQLKKVAKALIPSEHFFRPGTNVRFYTPRGLPKLARVYLPKALGKNEKVHIGRLSSMFNRAGKGHIWTGKQHIKTMGQFFDLHDIALRGLGRSVRSQGYQVLHESYQEFLSESDYKQEFSSMLESRRNASKNPVALAAFRAQKLTSIQMETARAIVRDVYEEGYGQRAGEIGALNDVGVRRFRDIEAKGPGFKRRK